MQESREDCEIRLEVSLLDVDAVEYIDAELSITVGAIRRYVEEKYNQNYPFYIVTLYSTLYYCVQQNEGKCLENDKN